MKRISLMFFVVILFFLNGLTCFGGNPDEVVLQKNFVTPPPEARLHAYWWWLNGNVTAEAITRDLEAMKDKGFGGALITDAGGANQISNRQVPRGPVFGSELWRKLYRHALREGKRLNLEMALNIQSGWNLGGPCVSAADAAKVFCWTETSITGSGMITRKLAAPASRRGLLGEIAVVAVPEPPVRELDCEITVSSSDDNYPPTNILDDNDKTWWVSDDAKASKDTLAWIQLAFKEDRAINAVVIHGRPGYGPKTFEVLAIGPDGKQHKLADGQAAKDGVGVVTFPTTQIRSLEIRVTSGYDANPVEGQPRNVQIAELQVDGPEGLWPSPALRPELIADWESKVLLKRVGGANFYTPFSMPAQSKEAEGVAPAPGKVLDLTRFVDKKGLLKWNAPAGAWRVYRFCYTVAPHAHVSTCSQGWEGLALDPMDAAAFQRYWDTAVEPLMEDAEAVGGHVLRYLHTDSVEIQPYNWTQNLPAEFKRRNGYDMVAWLPVLARRTIGSLEASERFLHDFRQVLGALSAENYYGSFLKNAHRHGMQVRAESGGPHGLPIDAQHCLGMIDVPMSEFWANSWRHRIPEEARFFVKQPASAAHTYGKKIVAAEGFTTIGPHWQATVWNNLRPNFDHALCEGLNQLVWTLVTCSPKEMGMPGQEMFPGTHFNPNVTWWRQSEAFLAYINRCQWMLRQGNPVADVLYYYGDHVPNFAGLRKSNPAGLPTAGYDYDVATEHVLLHRASVKDGRIVLPDGPAEDGVNPAVGGASMSYAALVLPSDRCMSLPVLRKLIELAHAGAVLIGPAPDSSSGLKAWQAGDAEASALIDRLWKKEDSAVRVKYSDTSTWLKQVNLLPDFEYAAEGAGQIGYIHRRDGETDIYFVNNCTDKPLRADIRFRVQSKQPELWDPRDGTTRALPEWRETDDGRIEVPLELDPYGSAFLVFRIKNIDSGTSRKSGLKNFPGLKALIEVKGEWDVTFDSDWYYPDNGSGGKVHFPTLVDWTKRPEEAIRYFSGSAVYHTSFDVSDEVYADKSPLYIELGVVHEMAKIKLNGRDLGIAWCPPWRLSVPKGLLTAKGNRLEIEVVNFWPNRLIGDTKLPTKQRRTKTNITWFDNPQGDKHYTTLMPSGLLGPVRLLTEDDDTTKDTR